MKNLLTGLICTCLLLIAGTLPGRAQDKKPDDQSANQTAAASSANQTAAASSVNQTAPATVATTDPAQPGAPADNTTADPQQAQQPPATPQQTPPAGQTPPTGQTPVPPPAEDQPTTPHSILAQPPPPPPKVPDVRRPGESGLFVGIDAWVPREDPSMNGGKQSPGYGTSTYLNFEGKPKFVPSVEVGLAVGLHNMLKLSVMDFRAAGDYTTPVEVTAWGQTYAAGTYISTNYTVQRAKLSFEYLTWPFPVGSRKIRLKTLWQVQFTNVNTVFDSPLDYYDSNGNLRIDPNTGDPIDLSGSGNKHIISPEFGLGFSYYPSRHVRFEMSGAGFGFPHKYSVWDGEISLNYRVLSHFEIGVGGRGFGFKTSTNADYYIKGNYISAFAGIRWYSNSE